MSLVSFQNIRSICKINCISLHLRDFPVAQMVKSLPAMQRPRFNPRAGKIPWRRKWLHTPVFLAGKSHGWRSLESYSPWGCKELDMTEWLHFYFHFSLSHLSWKNMKVKLKKTIPFVIGSATIKIGNKILGNKSIEKNVKVRF